MIETSIVAAIVLAAIVAVALWIKRSFRSDGGACAGCAEAGNCLAVEPDETDCERAVSPTSTEDRKQRSLPIYGEDK